MIRISVAGTGQFSFDVQPFDAQTATLLDRLTYHSVIIEMCKRPRAARHRSNLIPMGYQNDDTNRADLAARTASVDVIAPSKLGNGG